MKPLWPQFPEADERPAGALFRFRYARSNLASVLCRVIERTYSAPTDPWVTIHWQEDLGYLNATLADVAEDAVRMEDLFEPAELDDAVALELPYGYTQSRDVTAMLLPVRGDPLSNGWNAYWSTDVDVYDQIGESTVFAMRGVLQADFPKTIRLEDDWAELDLILDAPDHVLEGVSLATALAKAPIQIFAGDEILLGYTATLLAAGHYRLKVLRAQYGTTRGQHSVGAECWCVQLAELPRLEWSPPKDAVSAGLKVQPRLLHSEVSLADVAKVTHTIQRRSLRPLGPANLTANRDGAHPTYATGQDVVLDWTLTSEARTGSDPEVELECRADACVLELWAGAVLKATLTVSREGPDTLSNALLVAALGSETDFTVRAYLALGGYRSFDFDAITLCKT